MARIRSEELEEEKIAKEREGRKFVKIGFSRCLVQKQITALPVSRFTTLTSSGLASTEASTLMSWKVRAVFPVRVVSIVSIASSVSSVCVS